MSYNQPCKANNYDILSFPSFNWKSEKNPNTKAYFPCQGGWHMNYLATTSDTDNNKDVYLQGGGNNPNNIKCSS